MGALSNVLSVPLLEGVQADLGLGTCQLQAAEEQGFPSTQHDALQHATGAVAKMALQF